MSIRLFASAHFSMCKSVDECGVSLDDCNRKSGPHQSKFHLRNSEMSLTLQKKKQNLCINQKNNQKKFTFVNNCLCDISGIFFITSGGGSSSSSESVVPISIVEFGSGSSAILHQISVKKLVFALSFFGRVKQTLFCNLNNAILERRIRGRLKLTSASIF